MAMLGKIMEVGDPTEQEKRQYVNTRLKEINSEINLRRLENAAIYSLEFVKQAGILTLAAACGVCITLSSLVLLPVSYIAGVGAAFLLAPLTMVYFAQLYKNVLNNKHSFTLASNKGNIKRLIKEKNALRGK